MLKQLMKHYLLTMSTVGETHVVSPAFFSLRRVDLAGIELIIFTGAMGLCFGLIRQGCFQY